jgi:NADH-quinone oxidoreductase subunit K
MTSVVYQYLVVGAVLFSLGAVGFLIRRNIIITFLSAELMLQGVAINLLAFGRYHGNLQGQSFTVFVLTVAACESAVALALVVALYHRRRTLDVSAASDLSERSGAKPVEVAPPWMELAAPPAARTLPHLTPAGPEPRFGESPQGIGKPAVEEKTARV